MSDRFFPSAACAGALLTCLIAGAPAAHAAVTAPATQTDAVLIKHLPASHDLLTFRGESGVASWPVYLNRNEAAQVTTFQLGLLNTVSLLPERSSLKITINGRPLATMQIRSPDRMTSIPIRIPSGLLVPGFNEIQASVVMTHRVDCSVKATYELWTLFDPAQTGLLIPRRAAAGGKTIADLAGEPLADDGTTRIHLRTGGDANAIVLSRAADLIGALAARAHLVRPVVDIGDGAGSGGGFDVVLDKAALGDADMREVGRDGGLTLLRDPSTGRLSVVADVSDQTQFDATIDGLRRPGGFSAEGAPQGLSALASETGTPVREGRRLSFADLGMHSEAFAGRRLDRSLGLTLPRDFFPGSYGTARLYIDGYKASNLTANSTLVFRVNGSLVSSLPLGPSAPDRFDHAAVELPLQFFRPGYNAITIEGIATTAADEQCTLSTAPGETRLTIADTSEIELPHLARMQTAPQIASSLRFDSDPHSPGLDVYLTSADPQTVGAGLTMATNIAARETRPGHIRLNLDQPVATDKPGIVVGPLASLPDSLAKPVQQLVVDRAGVDPAIDADGAASTDQAVQAVPSSADSAQKSSASSELPAHLARSVLATGRHWLRNNGFFFASINPHAAKLAIGDQTLVVADVAANDKNQTVAGVSLPRFSQKSDRWLVVTGTSPEAMAAATETLVANDRWKDLAGEAVAYDPATDGVSRVDPTRLSYILPETVALGDVQPILGGIVSSNIVASVAVLLVLLSLLGLSTHAMLRVLGAKSR